ncbi:TlpA family protein disulfide reductase [Paenibacillus glycanilyticus]|uniref:TlpA family protein disulfide reductase n=1 Tax=Paenibacillus glycanilyticus TaxID=126569 RepID=UPI003EB9C68E
MKKSTWILIGAVAAFVLLSLYVTQNYGIKTDAAALAAETKTEAAKEPADDFTLKDLDGKEVTLSGLKGKPVYINFWATWCKWCDKEMPALEKVYQDYKDKGLVVLSVDVGEEHGEVAKYIAEKQYHFPVVLDSDKSVTYAYGIKSIPVSILVNESGDVVFRRVGHMTEEEMRAAIDPLFP